MANDQVQYFAYKVTKDYKAPLATAATQQEMTFKEYKKGDVIKGYEYAARPEDGIVPLVIVDDRWAFPKQFLQRGEKWGVNQVSAGTIADAKTLSSEIKKDLKNIASGNYAKKLTGMSSHAVRGVLIGVGIGFVIAWGTRSTSKFTWMAAGALLGGIAGAKMGQRKVEKEIKDAEIKTT